MRWGKGSSERAERKPRSLEREEFYPFSEKKPNEGGKQGGVAQKERNALVQP